MTTIELNGNDHPIPPGMTLAALLRQLELPAGGIAVAVNDDIIMRDTHDTHLLHPGDRVEIIHAIGGG